MTSDDFKEAVESRIIEWFDTQIKSAATDEARQLLKRMSKLIVRGGKRARPELLFMTYQAYGGENFDQLIDLGLALEFHHQFLLIHDDLIDNDTVRYGGPNIVGYYKQEKHNIPQAMGLLAGDILFSFACQIIIKHRGLTSNLRLKLLEMINEANIGVQYGQQLDVFNIESLQQPFTEDRLVLTHSLKSALYSAQLPMQCAAALLSLGSKERGKIDSFAIPFGILFQLVDDYSDYFNNQSAFDNRTKYRDFRQGKITYPLYIALKNAPAKELAFLKQHSGTKDLPDTIMSKVIAILKNCGAQETSREYLIQYFVQVYDALDKLSITPKSKKQLTALIERYEV
jgi:geranylgeranyl pyrophosphate synthase